MSERVAAWQCNLLLENEKCTTLLLSLDCLVMELIEWKKRPCFCSYLQHAHNWVYYGSAEIKHRQNKQKASHTSSKECCVNMGVTI